MPETWGQVVAETWGQDVPKTWGLEVPEAWGWRYPDMGTGGWLGVVSSLSSVSSTLAGLELVNIGCKNSTFHEERLAWRRYRVAVEWLH